MGDIPTATGLPVHSASERLPILLNSDPVLSYAQRYLEALLKSDANECIQVIGAYVQTTQDIPTCWSRIIQPAMQEIGCLWEEGAISVGQEHLATAITQRVMALYYPRILKIPRTKGTIIVAASPGELHEIGSRMLADILEIHGWNVYYTGANTPPDSLVDLVKRLQVQFLCISTTLPSNLLGLAAVINMVKVKTVDFAVPIRIIVGGQAYLSNPHAWEQFGADRYLISAEELIRYLEDDSSILSPSVTPPSTDSADATVDLLQDNSPQREHSSSQLLNGRCQEGSELIPLLLQHGSDVVLYHTACPIALLDQYGFLVEWNASMHKLCERLRQSDNIYQLLVSGSQTRFRSMLRAALSGQQSRKEMLHFTTAQNGLPISYECHIIPVPDSRVLFFADFVPPLDQRSAEMSLQVMNELATTTRALQKSRHELLEKEQTLAEALVSIERVAYIDELTQTLNRRSLMSRLEQEVDRSLKHGNSLSILLVDVDHFKQVNDQYGHQAGDLLLKLLAECEQHILRKTDILGRYGGEEFLVVLPDTDIHTATLVAQRLRAAIEAADFTLQAGLVIHKTVSIGVAKLYVSTDTVELLLARADSALYQAKEGGRNRVCIWESNESRLLYEGSLFAASQ